jgi:hypothetical protein
MLLDAEKAHEESSWRRTPLSLAAAARPVKRPAPVVASPFVL